MELIYKQHTELRKWQKEYKKIVTKQLKTRPETIKDNSCKKAIKKFKEERDELRAQIWTAGGVTHKKQNERYLKEIECHVECQEQLAREIQDIKRCIGNVEKGIQIENKKIYELSRLVVPESQQQFHVDGVRRKLKILENTLEANVRQEGMFTAANAELRAKLIHLFNNRTTFHDSYTKIIAKLTRDKKFMFELIEYVLHTVEGCIDAYERDNMLWRRYKKENELRRLEMKNTVRELELETNLSQFISTKNKARVQADLEEKECRRREEFRRKHKRELDIAYQMMHKIFAFTHTKSVNELQVMFEKQENLFYSFYKYANEMGYHITRLNYAVQSLYKDVIDRKTDISATVDEQIDQIKQLERQIELKETSNEKLFEIQEKSDGLLESLMQFLEEVCISTQLNLDPLKKVLGDYSNVNLVNYNRFLKLIEYRLQEIVAAVYGTEREVKRETKRSTSTEILYTVREIGRVCEPLTHLDDIVLTQQCPECAEGEEFNADDRAELVEVSSIEAAKKKLYDRIPQPEMQYRLHTLSKCHLPRSRVLLAQRQI